VENIPLRRNKRNTEETFATFPCHSVCDSESFLLRNYVQLALAGDPQRIEVSNRQSVKRYLTTVVPQNVWVGCTIHCGLPLPTHPVKSVKDVTVTQQSPPPITKLHDLEPDVQFAAFPAPAPEPIQNNALARTEIFMKFIFYPLNST